MTFLRVSLRFEVNSVLCFFDQKMSKMVGIQNDYVNLLRVVARRLEFWVENHLE